MIPRFCEGDLVKLKDTDIQLRIVYYVNNQRSRRGATYERFVVCTCANPRKRDIVTVCENSLEEITEQATQG